MLALARTHFLRILNITFLGFSLIKMKQLVRDFPHAYAKIACKKTIKIYLHLFTYLYNYLLNLSSCLSLTVVSFHCATHLPSIFLSIYLSKFLSIYLFNYLSIYQKCLWIHCVAGIRRCSFVLTFTLTKV